jgi:hypothetical protein
MNGLLLMMSPRYSPPSCRAGRDNRGSDSSPAGVANGAGLCLNRHSNRMKSDPEYRAAVKQLTKLLMEVPGRLGKTVRIMDAGLRCWSRCCNGKIEQARRREKCQTTGNRRITQSRQFTRWLCWLGRLQGSTVNTRPD